MNDYLKGKKMGKYEVRNGVELDQLSELFSRVGGGSESKNKIKVYKYSFGAKIVILGDISCISALV
jgi:hypothetical protein